MIVAHETALSQTGCVFGPDGLDGGGICCPTDGIEAQLPVIPALTISGRALEFTECRFNQENTVSISIGAPQRERCDQFRIAILVAAGGYELSGYFRAKYCRTWMDFDSSGVCRQRWRFLLNTDMELKYDGPQPPLLLEGFIAPCFNSISGYRPHYTGHLDYQCNGAGFEAALSLHHLPGCISHSACSISPSIPALFVHNDHSYHIVGPLPFSFADPGVASAWPFTMSPDPVFPAGESVRESRTPWSSYACLREARIAAYQQNTVGDQNGLEYCVCVSPTPSTLAERRWVSVSTFLNYDCIDSGVIGNVTTDSDPGFGVPISPCGPFGPFSGTGRGLIAMRVGSWTGGPFAGEAVHIFFGRVSHERYHADIAPPCPLPLDPARPTPSVYTFVHGVMTSYGTGDFGRLEPFSPTPAACSTYTSPRYRQFLDLANMYVIDPMSPADRDAFGVEFYSWIVWNLNSNAF